MADGTLDEQVADLLRASRAAHDRARAARADKQAQVAEAELRDARTLRLAALALDPERTVDAWAAEKPGHEQMMAFYVQKLGPA